jgi:uncharacterized protein (DUF488 family)
MSECRLWTIGHSTHTLDVFVGLLASHGIETLADVRLLPGSRRHPQFSKDALERSLPPRGIGYRHLAGLGGRRRPCPDSPNGGWRNASFRGYADYAMTEEFADSLEDLSTLASSNPTAAMCAEALWWRCHRRLIADRLLAAGWTVSHIGPDGRTTPHELTDAAVIRPDGVIVYPPPSSGASSAQLSM